MQQNRRVRARWVTSFAAIGVVSGVVAACVELKGELGADCLKNEDCQSGVCSQLHCAAPPALFLFDGGVDAGVDAADGAVVAQMDAPSPVPDTSVGDAPVATDSMVVGPDTGPEPTDATMDVIEETPAPDAPADAPVDAPGDAKSDAGENG